MPERKDNRKHFSVAMTDEGLARIARTKALLEKRVAKSPYGKHIRVTDNILLEEALNALEKELTDESIDLLMEKKE